MTVAYWVGRNLTRAISKVVFRVRVLGQEHIPQSGGFVLACNHASYFDPPLVGSCTSREVYFFAKKELFDFRLFGALLRRVNAMPVKRGTIDRTALESAVDVIRKGYGLTIFPEGTRAEGDAFLPPKTGIGLIAHQARCLVVPAYLHGTNKLTRCLTGPSRLSVVFGEPVSEAWIRSQPDDRDGYWSITREVMERIKLLKERLVAASAPAGT
ncbi:MAG TPA: lysophospholipid acyltransferase family protein [Candidatus Deferrimicrobium sp.]|nr:lysophospholipid acyltransferase family protein [Candidatus Deferrimicrobium sp.]